MLVNKQFPLTVRYAKTCSPVFHLFIFYSHDRDGKVPLGIVGASSAQRQWIGLSLTGDQATVERLPDPPHQGAPGFVQAIDIEVGFFRRGVEVPEVYSADDMAKNFVNAFSGIVMTVDQPILLEYHGQNLKGVIKSVVPLEIPGNPPSTMRNSGVISSETDVTILKSADSLIKIKSSGKKLASSPNLKQSTDITIKGTSQCDSYP